MNVNPTASYKTVKRGVVDPRKADILRFFNSLEYDIAAAGYIYDEVAEEYTDIPELAVGLDGFGISNKDAYHFEKYDFELTPEFRDYALSHLPA